MTLTNTAITGLRKQIKEHKDCIKDLKKEIADIEKDFGKTEHPLQAIIRKYRRVAKLKPQMTSNAKHSLTCTEKRK